MSAKVILTATSGSLKGQQFEFSDRTTCIIGRAPDCHPRLPNDKTISRYHCLLDINPPDIRIRDFGSKNGTYVNGKMIGKRQPYQTLEEGARTRFPEYDLKEGDEIKLRNTVFRVSIEGAKNDNVGQAALRESPVDPRQSCPSTLELQYAPTIVQVETSNSNFPCLRGYTTLKWLGKGEFGEVYLAHHNQNRELVAIKVMRSPTTTPDAIKRFLEEVEKIKALHHPNIVQLKESGYEENSFFFTLDYCKGGSVADLMRYRDGQLSIDEAISITLQVLDGLQYAHTIEISPIPSDNGITKTVKGLVHRDLKPTNIFLSTIGLGAIAKIANYGLTTAFDLAGLGGLSRSGIQVTPPAFMPRQQVIDLKYAKPEVDVWAVAACLYYMLTGTVPRNFTHQDPFLVVLQINPVPIRERNASIPKPLAEVIDLALVDHPNLHFKNAGAFKRALESVL
ncbi:MAG TPA: serine/threonine protein kinase [Cyanobacteria bacterium UBA12227]|nr:serine/threonine protein kinase [Cyanobacteria bacterium UBA12227]HAX87846.1 serine/threonine protein kinase [Cyanobacteria bacterium UBA11370]HBY75962.1 serine/threonine protein kinase [Cyanobacteria bacterium UBA11148]